MPRPSDLVFRTMVMQLLRNSAVVWGARSGLESLRVEATFAGNTANLRHLHKSRSELWPGKSFASGSKRCFAKQTAVTASPTPVAISFSLPS